MKFRVLLFLMLVLSSFSGSVFAYTYTSYDEALTACQKAVAVYRDNKARSCIITTDIL